ncbi:hypothetical protein ACJJV6_06135 [Arthrobacter nitrophenolicus]|uniref:hypothetical protein n=1 Tax=Arthrobacter nitrophenolicus TaxID=683150 RepID=UPI003899D9CA
MSDTAGSRSDAVVDQLLLEAELDDDGQLRPALLQLRALGDVTPEPSADVAALLQRAQAVQAAAPCNAAPCDAVPSAAVPAPVDELAARRRAKRRVALTALSVAVSLSAGGAVAAASDRGFRDSFNNLHRTVTSFVTGTAPAAPAGNQAEEPAAPAPSVPAAPATVPTAPATAPEPGQPAEAAPSDVPAAPAKGTGESDAPGRQLEVPGAKDLPTAVPEDLTNGVGQQPQVPVPGPSDLHLPETLPAVPLR